MELTRRNILASAGGALALSLLPWDIAWGAGIIDVRVWPSDEYSRITIEHDGALKFKSFVVRDSAPLRMVVDIEGLVLSDRLKQLAGRVSATDPIISSIRVGQNQGSVVRMVIGLKADVKPEVFELAPVANYKRRLVVDLYPKNPAATLDDDPIAAALRGNTSDSQSTGSSLAQSAQAPAKPGEIMLMIDPGHGGEDPGATGSGGTHEKDVVLSIAKKLESLVAQESGMRCALTRRSDFFVPLGERVRLAQKAKANLFVSIHADAWTSPAASGSSVFALSEKGASSAAARWLAQKQNEADLIGGINLADLKRNVQNVLVDMSNTWKIGYSLALGRQVLGQLGRINNLHKKQVEQAGFAVLKGHGIPSILVETAFISNPAEERSLKTEDFQWQIARGILAGIKSQTARDRSILQG